MWELWEIIGASGGLLVGIALLGVLIWAVVTLRRVVPTNFVHIVQSRRKTTPYGREKGAGNVYYEWPYWLPFFGVTVIMLPESNFDIILSDYEAYDAARLPFQVDVVAFFRIHDAETAAQRIASFTELKTQLLAVLQGSVRRILATNSLELIMQERSTLGTQFTEEVREQIKEWGVTPVKSIEFMDLKDSAKAQGKVIANIMAKEQSRIEMESRVVVANNLREAELKEIDAQRVVEVQRQEAAQLVGQRTAEKEQQVGISEEQAKQKVLTEAKRTAENTMEVKRVQDVRAAEIAKDVIIVQSEQDMRMREIDAEAAKSVAVTRATGEKAATVTIAEGDLQKAKLNAEGIKAEGLARGAAEQAVLMAPVNSQIALAKEIGENPGYQTYLISIRTVEAQQNVGIEAAKALQQADLKVISNAGSPQEGLSKITDLFTTTGGTNMAGMLAALAQTEEGAALVEKVTNTLKP
jgi:flotillin